MDINGETGDVCLSQNFGTGCRWAFDPDQIPPAPGGGPDADSRKTVFEQFLRDNLAIGNAREATVNDFDFRGTSLHFKVTLRHHQTDSLINYVFETTVEGDYDPYDAQSIANTRICTILSLPSALGGDKELCVTLGDIVAALLS